MSLIRHQWLYIISIYVLVIYSSVYEINCQIHRAASQTSGQNNKVDLNQNLQLNYKIDFEQNSTYKIDDKLYVKNSRTLTWVMSVIGALLVGLSGILPVAVLPHLADNHQKLSQYFKLDLKLNT